MYKGFATMEATQSTSVRLPMRISHGVAVNFFLIIVTAMARLLTKPNNAVVAFTADKMISLVWFLELVSHNINDDNKHSFSPPSPAISLNSWKRNIYINIQ